MTPIDINEAHKILLDIAKAFVKVCESNHIPYYMLGGTMLGAIRHQGFIPWDDDMDFGVPRKHYERLISSLERELPYPYRCCTYHNGLTTSVIFKIDDSRTIIKDIHISEKRPIYTGLNIDIFALDYCAPNDKVLKKLEWLRYINRAKYASNPNWSKSRIILNKIIDLIFPWPNNEINERMEHMLTDLKPAPFLSNVFGAWGLKECIPVEWYGEGQKFVFEDTEFCGLKEYDKYLHQLYGEYMTPPKHDIHIHLDSVFWKDK